MTALRLTICTFALAIAGVAGAALDPVENIIEIGYLDVRLPAHEADQISLRDCGHCGALDLRVTADTAYRIGGFDAPAVSLQEFRAALRQTKRKSDVLIYIAYAPADNTVNAIVVAGGTS